MAILTVSQFAALRQACAPDMPAINYTKAQANAALQAIEDLFDGDAPILKAEVAVGGTGFRALLSARIDAATTPFVFTAAQKTQLVKHWLRSKFERGG